MYREKLTLLVAAVATLSNAQVINNNPTVNTNRPDIYGLINILYLKADANLDQTITQAELADVFHGFDKNGDGNVTNAEFVELWKALTGQTTELADAYFHLADITDDKVINQADYGLLYHVFDLNSDRKVTAQEFAKKWEDIIRETPFAVLFERADTDKDEFLSRSEFGSFFGSFDTDGNSRITKTEFANGWHSADFALLSDADRLFALLDNNHDSAITATPDMSHQFTVYDTNQNGQLDLLEVIQMKSLLVLNTHGGGSPVG